MSAQPHSIFISYRRADSVYAVDQLDQRLKLAFGEEAVFRDASSIAPGAVFPERIRRALDLARVALVVIGPWWLRTTTDPSDSHGPRRLDDAADWVAIEIETLLGRGDGVAVIPVLLGGASIPKPADLPPALAALSSRNGVTLPPFPEFEDGLRRVIEAVAKLLGVAAPPFAPPSTAVEERPRFGGNGFNVTGKNFVGREPELHLLDEAWGRAQKEDKINIVSLIGQGGEGKSALVLEWQARRSRHGWQGARRVFEWSFYSQGSIAQSNASADDFFSAAFAWFDNTAEVPRDPFTKGAKLAELVAAERTLLVLDGVEPLQQPPGGFSGEFKDPAMKALLRGLARHNPGLCILTSRTDITDLGPYEHRDGSCLRHPLDSLDPVAARALLRELGVLGPDRELDEAAECFHCHAYDLNLLGNYIAKCTPDRDVRGWQQGFPVLKEDERVHPRPDAAGKRAGHGRRMLRAYERWLEPPVGWKKWLPPWLGGRKPRRSPALAVLRLLGLFDRPARSDLLDELRAAPVIPGLTEALVSLPQDDWLLALDQLQGLGLIHREPLSVPAERPRRAVTFALDTHPLLREHFGAELRAQNEAGRREGHRRLYAYLCATTKDKPEPTLEDLQPLYQAVAHGCQAELHTLAFEEVYWQRISRGEADYSARQLSAFSSDLNALSGFFTTTWNKPVENLPKETEGRLMTRVGSALRARCDFSEARTAMENAIAIHEQLRQWEPAAKTAGDLCGALQTLDQPDESLAFGKRSIEYGQRVGKDRKRWDLYYQVNGMSRIGATLHRQGQMDDARSQFQSAEALERKEMNSPMLSTLAGVRYCDFLVDCGECEEVRSRWEGIVAETKKDPPWWSPLDKPLFQLVLARAALAADKWEEAKGWLDEAGPSLRSLNLSEFVSMWNLLQSQLLLRRDNLDGAEKLLEEAKNMIERNELESLKIDHQLLIADLHLRRGSWVEARKELSPINASINQYHGRKAEYERLQAALRLKDPEWPLTSPEDGNDQR